MTMQASTLTTGLLVAALLAGCAGWAPPAARPAPPAAPDSWRHGPVDTAAAPTSAWPGLQDSVLDGLAAQAQARNRDVARAAVRLQQAGVLAERATLDRWPVASASAGATVARALDDAQAPSLRSSSAGATLAWEPDLWGRLARQGQAAAAAASASEADLAAARWLLATQVAEPYWTLGLVAAKQALAAEAEADAKASLAALQLRVAVGKERENAVDRAQAALRDAQLRRTQLQAQAAQASVQLALLLDESPQHWQPPAARLPDSLPERPALAPPAAVLDRRPDLRRARAALQESLLRADIAAANLYPRLTLSLGVSSGGPSLRDVLANPLGSLGLALALPVLDAPRLRADSRVAALQAQEQQLVFRDTLFRALGEVETLLLQREQLVAEADAATLRHAHAGRALDVATRRVEAGADAPQALRDARQARRDTEAALLDLRLKAWLNQVALAKALGGS